MSKAVASTACPFCEEVPASHSELGRHLLAFHYGTSAGEKGKRLSTNKKGTVRCWCGAWFVHGVKPAPAFLDWALLKEGEEWSAWGKHLQRTGGAVAHFLALSLGVKP